LTGLGAGRRALTVWVGWDGVLMIDHISFQTDDAAAAVAWCDAVLAPLEAVCHRTAA
jgi:hypothetical protein